MEWKSFLGHCLEIIWLNYFPGVVFDSNFLAVKVGNNDVDAGQGFAESDFLFVQQIGTFSLKFLVGLLLNDNDHITCLGSRVLVSFAVESVLAIVGGALVDDSF